MEYRSGLDLLDYFRGDRPWGQLVRIVAGLPDCGKFKSAMAMDEDLAAVLADMPDPEGEPPPLSPHGYGLLERLVLRQNDLIKQLIHVTIGAAGGKPGAFQPEPRPSTAIERARAAKDTTAMRGILADLGIN